MFNWKELDKSIYTKHYDLRDAFGGHQHYGYRLVLGYLNYNDLESLLHVAYKYTMEVNHAEDERLREVISELYSPDLFDFIDQHYVLNMVMMMDTIDTIEQYKKDDENNWYDGVISLRKVLESIMLFTVDTDIKVVKEPLLNGKNWIPYKNNKTMKDEFIMSAAHLRDSKKKYNVKLVTLESVSVNPRTLDITGVNFREVKNG